MSQQSSSLVQEVAQHPFYVLSRRQLCDIELILNGAFAPLTTFMNQADYQSVLRNMYLANNQLFPIPVTLDISETFAKLVSKNEKITLRDQEMFVIAVMKITDIWHPDLEKEALSVYGTTDTTHPAVHHLVHESNPIYISGELEMISSPSHTDFVHLRKTPDQTKAVIQQKNWRNVVAFQTRNPMHRAHFELTLNAMEKYAANLLLHPVVGITKPMDIDYYTRVHCYSMLMKYYPKDSAYLSLLPLAMRMGGPRECLWHGLIRKNFGCTHFIVGRDHAGPGKDKQNKSFYGKFDAQTLFKKHEEEIGITLVPYKEIAYSPTKKKYVFMSETQKTEEETWSISGTELREILDQDKPIPEWFTFPEIAEELKKSRQPLKNRGFTVFFTGLSGSGKSTLAHTLINKLMEIGKRNITLLDGDIVRRHLSSELGFSKEHRSINVRRIGFVAAQITKNNGIAICAPIAPYDKDRLYNRHLISQYGGYIEIYISTPLEVCEQRDVKGFYKRARQNITQNFTGINDTYEVPLEAEITIDTTHKEVLESTNIILEKIRQLGYL